MFSDMKQMLQHKSGLGQRRVMLVITIPVEPQHRGGLKEKTQKFNEIGILAYMI